MFDLRLSVARAALGRPRGKALAGVALAVCLAVPGGEAAAARRAAKDCVVQKFSEGVGTGTGWNPPQVGNIGSGVPVGTVLATRGLSISSQFNYTRNLEVDSHVVHGAHWNGMGWSGISIVPTNVPGVGLRVKPAGASWALKLEREIRAYASRALEWSGEENPLDAFPSGLTVELVVTGTIPSGIYQVTGPDPDFSAARMTIKMVQMASQPASGADISLESGKLSAVVCNSEAWFTVEELITIGGVTPPLVTAVCNVDARYVGYGREVTMGRVAVGDFPRPGARAGTVPFSISLSDCAAGAKPKLALYAGVQGLVPGVPALRVDSAFGYARNVGIVLTRQGETTPLAIGAGAGDLNFYPFSSRPAVQGATANFDLEAHYQRTDHDTPVAPGVRPGRANSSVRFQVRYD
ncbi:fimbrial protein [Achromobacter veterisilvae]|uniref:Fimbrial protein n=1 Tax=Achromobacter veterisilvae TaxID=2069367 RepID=A0ABZ2RV96_9BURK|nr:fimbrial protein [Achromobacter sp.]MCW0205643.1 type 1 fimbrial protein [Achromobacter sp.]